MAERKPIDEFVFIIMAGLVLMSIVIVYQYSQQNQTQNISVNQTLKMKFFNFGGFSVEYQIGTETVLNKENLVIEKGVFSENFASYEFEITTEKLSNLQDAYIVLEISSNNKMGKLIVKVNNQEIVNDVLEEGRNLIRIPKAYLKTKNVVSLSIERLPSFAFWKAAVYRIDSFKVYINYAGQSFKDFTFDLDSLDIKNFDNAYISFLVKDSSVKAGKLFIYLNGGKIYDRVPPSGYVNITIDFVAKFKEGRNKIEFSVEPNSKYDIDDLSIAIVKK